MARAFFRGIRRGVVNALSLDRMSEEFLVLTANYIFLLFYTTLESVFVNTLLYRITPDIRVVILYRVVIFAVSASGMQLGAYLARKLGPVAGVRLGCMFYAVMYLCLFFGMGHMDFMMYPSAVFAGLGGAFYWSGHNTLLTQYTNASNRDVGVSIMCVVQGVMVVLVPIFTGSVISLLERITSSVDTGYRVMFGICIVIVFAQMVYQRRLTHVEALGRGSELKRAIKLFSRDSQFKCLICSETLRGFREGAFTFILSMALFEIITSETLVGVNSLLTGIMSILGAWAYGRFVWPPSRVRYAVAATTALSAFCLLLRVWQNAASVMVYASINAFFALFILNISFNNSIDTFIRDDDTRRCLAESLAIREGFIAAGRILGCLLFLLFPDTLSGRIYAMLVLTVTQYAFAFFVWLNRRISLRRGGAS